MDLNGLFTMLSRIFIRSAVRTGIDYAVRGGKPDRDLTPEERQQAKAARQMAQKAQKVARLGQRFLK
jgi:hypothetical protein